MTLASFTLECGHCAMIPCLLPALDQKDDAAGHHVIHGRVVDATQPDGTTFRIRVLVNQFRELKTIEMKSELDGSFEVLLPAKCYPTGIIASNENQTRWAWFALYPYRSKESPIVDVRDVLLQLEPTNSTRVSVLKDGQPVAGASVRGHHSGGFPFFEAKTNDEGQAVLRFPEKCPVEGVWAFHKTLGVAFWYPEATADSSQVAGQHRPSELTLEMLPTAKYELEVNDSKGKPLEGVKVFPYFRVEGDSNRKFFLYFRESYEWTNANGGVSFDWLPAKPAIWFLPDLIGANYRIDPDDSQRGGTLRARRKTIWLAQEKQFYPITGKVNGPPGIDLSGIEIVGEGRMPGLNIEKFTVKCKEDGTFEANVLPGLTYGLAVQHKEWASDVFSNVCIDVDGKQLDEIQFDLYPATRLTVSITRKFDKQPLTTGRVAVFRFVTMRYSLPGGQNVEDRIFVGSELNLDENGIAEFGVGKGEYSVISSNGQWSDWKDIEIKDTEPITLNIQVPWSGTNEISGTLSVDDSVADNVALDECDIVLSEFQYHRQSKVGRADSDGDWVIPSNVAATFVAHVYSNDKRFGDFQIVRAPGGLPVDLGMKSTARVFGRVIDTSGEGVGELEIVQHISDEQSGIYYYGSAHTDDEGNFEMDGVFVGVAQRLAIHQGVRNFEFLNDEVRYQAGEVRTIKLVRGDKNE